MSAPEDWRAQLLEAAANNKLEVSVGMLELIDSLSRRPPLSVQSTGATSLPLSTELIKAAITDTFTTTELSQPDDAIPGIIRNSLVVMMDGQRRLRLDPTVRADVLRRARQDARFEAALSLARAADAQRAGATGDALANRQSVWLRKFIAGDVSPDELVSAHALRAATQARAALPAVGLPDTVPTLAELQSRLGLAELLEPLCILIGRDIGDSGVSTDRFVGREAELRDLRIHVDELASESLGEILERGAQSLGRAIRSGAPGVLMLVARGGLGKSSLIAKFVLDHAAQPLRPFPFAYLDFDRATLQARPTALLEETARQVALQFPRFRDALAARRTAGSSSNQQLTVGAFRELLRNTVFSTGVRSFLLVLDTLEIAQRDPRTMRELVSFINALSDGGFRELRIVAAGRVSAPQLLASAPGRRDGVLRDVPPLTVSEATEMADKLGGLLLGVQWQVAWAARVAGKESDPPGRREPLVIRVAVELLKSNPPEKRDSVSLEIAKLGEHADDSFAGALYHSRVLNHLGDTYAGQLAWPGLVLRSITREIARDLLAPLCRLPTDLVDHAFEALAREVWIVESSGDVLWHRRDLRSRTLAHMRRHDRELFDRVNAAAVAYFGVRIENGPSERSEWIYHRLLSGEDFTELYKDWDDNTASYLGGAWEDFTVLYPRAANHLRALTETSSMDPAEFAALGRGLTLDHIARTAPWLATFDDTQIKPAVLAAARLTDSTTPLSANGKAAELVLAVKTGDWDSSHSEFVPDSRVWQRECTFAFRFCRARILDAAGAKELADDIAEDFARRFEGEAVADSDLDADVLLQHFASCRIWQLPLAPRFERVLERALLLRPDAKTSSLRLAGALSETATNRFVGAWIDRRRVTGQPLPTVCSKELRVLVEDGDQDRCNALRKSIDRAGKNEGLTFARITRRDCARIAYEPVVRAFEDHVLLLTKIPEASSLLRKLLVVRNEDWIVPLGYAAQLCFDNEKSPLPKTAPSLLKSYGRPLESGHSATMDCLQALQYADEAGDLMSMLDALIKASRVGVARERLQRLAQRLAAWQLAITDLQATGPVPQGGIGNSDRPTLPIPGPGTVPGDPQKGRWGGKAQRNGRNLTAVLTGHGRQFVILDFIVTSTDGSPLQPPILFHLHDTYPRSIIRIRKIRDDSTAILQEVSAYGVYTVGAQVQDASGHWIGLEFDLANLKGLPAGVLRR